MKKLTLSCLSLLLASGLAQANTPCDGFEIKIVNNTADKLISAKSQVTGADLQPQGINVIQPHSEQVYTVNHSGDNAKMKAIFQFKSVSIPVKDATIEFNLTNKHLICHHGSSQTSGDYQVNHSRSPGKIKYKIG